MKRCSVHRMHAERQEEASTLKNMGEVYDTLGMRGRAFACYEQALDHFRALADRRGEGPVLYNLGVLQRKLHKNEESLQCYTRAYSQKPGSFVLLAQEPAML
jgi:tetratricopeptide (TPR) repeat protein